MEEELYNMIVKGNDLKTYVRRLQELAVLRPNMVMNIEKLLEVFIRGLPRSIEGNVTALKPQTLEEAINITQRLIDQNKRQKTFRTYAATNGYTGNHPWVAGANNDLTVLNNSLLFDDLLDEKVYYLADGIYPTWTTFVKSFFADRDVKNAVFKWRQDSAQKDVERAFGGTVKRVEECDLLASSGNKDNGVVSAEEEIRDEGLLKINTRRGDEDDYSADNGDKRQNVMNVNETVTENGNQLDKERVNDIIDVNTGVYFMRFYNEEGLDFVVNSGP
nr:reverse transcriptase domain-containing protein [Tanacetum cinerariifolium]